MGDQAIDTKIKRTKKSKIGRSQQPASQINGSEPNTTSVGTEVIQELSQVKTYSNGIPKNNQCTLSHKELIEFFHGVVDKKEEQRQALLEVKASMDDNDDGSNGLDDFLGSKVIDDRVSLQLIALHREQLKKLSQVEERMRKGEFTNICAHCSGEIEFQRLKLVPDTRYCCQCNKKFG